MTEVMARAAKQKWVAGLGDEPVEGMPDLVVQTEGGELYIASIHATGIEGEAEHNAVLIAAAPELLRLARRVLDDPYVGGAGACYADLTANERALFHLIDSLDESARTVGSDEHKGTDS